MECYLNLDAIDIRSFAGTGFQNVYFIKNTLWRVISINNYLVGGNKSTKVTLLKVIEKLTNDCGAIPTFTNTGLMTWVDAGTGASTNVTGVGFKPDWVLIKCRSQDVTDHVLFDRVRGAGQRLVSGDFGDEETQTGIMSAFVTDGVTVGTGGASNGSSRTYAMWNWLAGGSASSNSNGSITSNVSANQTAGFSIVTYTGTGSNATVGHGLGSVPRFIVTKDRDSGSSYGWYTYHASQGATKNLYFHTADSEVTSSDRWQDTTPTSSVFYVGTNGGVNGSSSGMLAYCFAEKKGYSKFGTYKGTGNADGAFVYTGFRPAWVLFKRTNGNGNWQLIDDKRLGYNPESRTFYINNQLSEQDETDADILSNGFRLTNTGSDGNGSGDTYVYLAFAHSPFVNSNGEPNKAR